MVSIASARSSIQAGQQLVARQKQQIQQRTTQPGLTAAEVRRQTQSSIARRQVEAQKLSSIKKQALETLKPIEKSLSKASSQVSSVESQLREQTEREAAFKRALDVFRGDDPRGVFGLSKLERNFFRQISAGKTTAIRLGIEKQIKELESKGLSPIFVNGELRGISDLLTKQSRELGELKPIIIQDKLVGFGDIALQLSREIPTPIPIEVVKPIGVVLPSLTFREQLAINVKESVPEFAFIKDEDLRRELKRFVPPGVALGIGGLRSAESEFKEVLSDPTGVFKFTREQSERIAGLTKEIIVNIAGGLVVGKVVTLVRGAGARFLPKALKESPKFQKVTNILGGGVALTLTAGAGLSIKKTFEQEGIDAAVQETIGLIAFGIGFAKTGLKTTAQAEEEFRKLTSLLKKGIPESKRGQAALIRKKKKKPGELRTLEEAEAEALVEREASLRGLERKIAEQKTAELQLQILRRIQRSLKTKEQKEGFKKFVQELLDKNILKVPEIKVAPGITAKVIGKPKKPILASRLRHQQRVQRNLARNQKRIADAQKPIGQRFKEAQALIGVSAVGLTTAQRIKEEQKERQKLIQRQRTEQKTKQQQQLRLILRQRSASKNKLRELLRNSLKTGRALRPKLKIKFKVPFVPPKLPKIKEKKKVLKKIPFEISGNSFDVFERRRGKFRKIASDLPPNLAQRTLQRRLDNRISASGRIIPSKNPPKKKDISKFRFPSRKFRRPVPKSPLRKKGVFTIVEKSTFRIDSQREKDTLRKARALQKRLSKIPLLRNK